MGFLQKAVTDAALERQRQIMDVPPTPADPSVQAAADAVRRPRGRAATIFTGGEGLDDFEMLGVRRTLLGF